MKLYKAAGIAFAFIGAANVGAGTLREYAPIDGDFSLRDEYQQAAACQSRLSQNQTCELDQQKALSEVRSNETLIKRGSQMLLAAAMLL